jgi:hypothetical protein
VKPTHSNALKEASERVHVSRTLLLSSRSYQKDVWRCGQVEFEDVVRAIDHVDVIAPKMVHRKPGVALQKADRLARRLLAVSLSHLPRLESVRLTRDYEVFCLYVQGLADLDALDAVPEWRKRCVKAVCVIEEIWALELGRWGKRTLERLAEFDLITCGQHGTVAPLEALIGKRCEWVPGGVDCLRFFPGREPPRRSIDVFAMGRRSEVSHRALLSHASARDWTYLFDTVDPRQVRAGDHTQHRLQLAEMVKRSRYFIASKSRIGAVHEIGAQEELGFRSFEGAAGGAVLVGHAPRGEHVSAMFDWPDAHVHVPYDSAELPDILAALDRDPERVARIRRDNVANSLRRHDWAVRWGQVLTALGVAPTERLARRVRELEELAALTESASSAGPHAIPITAA